jgi:hypothetical protein
MKALNYPSSSYFLSMILMILLWFRRITLAMIADWREAGGCSPGHTIELSSYGVADSHE